MSTASAKRSLFTATPSRVVPAWKTGRLWQTEKALAADRSWGLRRLLGSERLGAEAPTSDGSNTPGRHRGSAARPTDSELRSFVGREQELARLRALLATVRDGASAVLVVRGEPGVGKSALLEQLIGSAADVQ